LRERETEREREKERERERVRWLREPHRRSKGILHLKLLYEGFGIQKQLCLIAWLGRWKPLAPLARETFVLKKPILDSEILPKYILDK